MRSHARVLIAIAALASFFAFATTASAEYEYAGTLATAGSGDGELGPYPGRAAVEHSTGNLFAVDTGNDRVQVLKPTGVAGADYLAQFGAGQLSDPYGIAIDENGGQTYVYVADAGNSRIVKYASDEAATPSFTLDGSFNLTPGKVGGFKAPLAVDPTTHDLLVGDPGDSQVERFGADGSFKSAFDGSTAAGSPGPMTGLRDIATNAAGDVYVVARFGEVFNFRALRYDGTGTYKAELAPVGLHQQPGTVAVDPGSGAVAVSGNQQAIEYFESPSLHLFDSANAPLESPAFDYQFAAFSGLAFSGTRIYAVLDVPEGNPYGFPSAPRLDVFADLHKPSLSVDPVAKTTTTATSAKFTGTVNPNGLASEWHFEYSADDGASWSSTATQSAGSGTSPVAVSAEATGLEQETPYLVRLVAANADGQRISAPRSFVLTYVREVSTGSASNRTPTGATLNGVVNPGGLELTECEFEYGTTTAYGQSVPCAESNATIGSGETPIAVHADVSGLAGTDYHFRLVASNADGTTSGEDSAFSIVLLPVVSGLTGTVSYPEASYAEARLKAKINPGNGKTTYRVEYGPTAAYGQSTPDRELAVSTLTKDIFTVIAPLAKNAIYHFRIIANNESGSTSSDDLTLTTGPGRPADTCPNAAIRAVQGSSRLGECRAYEMVTPLDKAGNDVSAEQVSADGNSIEFYSGGGLPGVGAQSGVSHYRSTRLGTDWSQPLSIDPPQKANAQNLKFQQVLAVSEDQSRAFVYSSMALAPGAVAGGGNIYMRDLDTDAYHLIASNERFMGEFAQANAPCCFYIEGTPDFSRVLFNSDVRLTDDAPEPDFGKKNLYEWSFADGLRLAAYNAGGDPIVGTRPYGPKKTYYYSRDGSRVLYNENNTSPSESLGLYLKEGSEVVQVSASQRSGDDPSVVQLAAFRGSNPDLSAIFFQSSANLTDASNHAGHPAIYRYDVDSGTLLDLTRSFGTSTEDTEKLDGFFHTILGTVTPDGGAIYLASSAVMAPGGSQGAPFAAPTNIYRFTANSIEHVSTLPTAYDVDFRFTGTTSPNGRYFAYETTGGGTDDVSTGPSCKTEIGFGEFNNECQQVYIYDSVAKSFACASCDPTGAPSRGSSSMETYSYIGSRYRNLTNQGLLVFQTFNPLSSEDVNDRRDVYTWRDGQIDLISSGKGSSDSFFNDMSVDGSTVVFTTREKLVGRDEDDLADIYVARVNGGLASQVAAVKPAICEGAECKGPATSPPSEPSAATANFSGQGNARPKPKSRCAKGSKRIAKKSKSRCVKKKSKKGKERAAGAKRGSGR